jgi:hypothetical protein
MRYAIPCGEIQEAERLFAELKAIELWDLVYWRGHRHQAWEIVAMLNRRDRRTEVISELISLIQGWRSQLEVQHHDRGGKTKASKNYLRG